MEEKRYPEEILMSKILQERKKFDEAIQNGKEFSEAKEIKLQINKLVDELNKLIAEKKEKKI